MLHQDRGEYGEALRYYEQSLRIAEELGDRVGVARSLHQLGRKIKVRCNGPERHINEIDLERLLEPTYVVRGDNPAINLNNVEFPLYDDCRYCAGQVIITREIVEQAR